MLIFHLLSYITLLLSDASPFSLVSARKLSLSRSKQTIKRNLDTDIHSVPIAIVDTERGFSVALNIDNPNDIPYRSKRWGVLISSNETIMNLGGCLLFYQFTCKAPDCYEDTSLQSSANYTLFSSDVAIRLNLTDNISIADGAWKLSSFPLGIYDCNAKNIQGEGNFRAMGQIGLGLSGEAYKNFQNSNPVFSIIFHSVWSAELIFGINSAHIIDKDSGIILHSDLDWKMQVSTMTIGNFTISNQPMTMIFDLQELRITLSANYYSSLRSFLFDLSIMSSCIDLAKKRQFVCFYLGELQDLPTLAFSLKDGTQFILPPLVYMIKEAAGYLIWINLYNDEFSGAEYIVLGRQVMRHYYTVFQLMNQTPTITAYFVPESIYLDGLELNPLTVSKGFNPIESFVNTTKTETTGEVNHSEGAILKDTSTSTSVANQESMQSISTSDPKNIDHNPDHSLFYVVVVIFIVVVICIFVVLTLVRKRRPKSEGAERPRPSLELHESSSFMSIDSDKMEEKNNMWT